MAVRLNNQMVDELKNSFRFRDYDNDGKIFSRDVAAVIRSVKGLKPSQAEIREIISVVDSSGGMIDLEKLVELVSKGVTTPEPDGPMDIAKMFQMYDKNDRGLISIQDMIHVLTHVGEKLSEEEAKDLLKLSEAVERGMVDYKKFVKTIMSS